MQSPREPSGPFAVSDLVEHRVAEDTSGDFEPAWGEIVSVWPANETRPITVRRKTR